MTTLTLADAPLATPLILSEIPGKHALPLSRQGLRPGAVFTVVRRSTGGGRVVSVAGARVALGRSLLRGIRAEVVQ